MDGRSREGPRDVQLSLTEADVDGRVVVLTRNRRFGRNGNVGDVQQVRPTLNVGLRVRRAQTASYRRFSSVFGHHIVGMDVVVVVIVVVCRHGDGGECGDLVVMIVLLLLLLHGVMIILDVAPEFELFGM